jgi:hypothetical protein
MIGMLARRTLGDRPRRTAILLLGLGIAVGVMITLLSIGEAVLEQARDKDLVGGGDLVLLPAGIDVDVMKVGGSTGMYYLLENARFLFRQVLSGPRLAPSFAAVKPEYSQLPLAAVSPALVEKVLYVRKVGNAGREPIQVLAHGYVPSLDAAVGGPTIEFARQGIEWRDHHADRMWTDPPTDSLFNWMDRFHLPPPDQPDLDRWGEWLYFNFTDSASGAFGYVSYIVGNDIAAGQGRAGTLVQIKRPGEPARKFGDDVPFAARDMSLARVDLRIGTKSTARFVHGAWRLHFDFVHEEGPVRGNLIVRPFLDLHYPPFLIHESERFISGYTVPALRTLVSGTLEVPGARLDLNEAIGYHDHNWGTWRNVHWDWGTASSDEYALLYGRVQHPELEPGRAGAGIFLMLSRARHGNQRGGMLALFQPRSIEYEWGEAQELPGNPARTPRSLRLQARGRGGPADVLPSGSNDSLFGPDSIDVHIDVRQISSSPPREGEELVFLQMQADYRVRARIAGRDIEFATRGFAEVFVPSSNVGGDTSAPFE